LAEAVYKAFLPRKLNYELLGNSEAHLHWHIFPRYQNDPIPQWPVWAAIGKGIVIEKDHIPDRQQRELLINKIRENLEVVSDNFQKAP